MTQKFDNNSLKQKIKSLEEKRDKINTDSRTQIREIETMLKELRKIQDVEEEVTIRRNNSQETKIEITPANDFDGLPYDAARKEKVFTYWMEKAQNVTKKAES